MTDRIKQWQATYDAILDLEDPQGFNFPNISAEKAFEQEGISLAHQLQAELGSEYEVYYRKQSLTVAATI